MVLSAPGVGHDADDQKDMIVWIQTRIKLSNFNNISQLWNDEDHTCIVSEFLVDPSIKSLFATVDRCLDNKLILSCNAPPEPSPGRIDVAYFIRAQGSKLCLSNIDDVLLFGTFAMHQTASSVLNIMEKVFFPHIFYTTDWNESSRRELMGLYHRFMATLTESANEESGRTVLYLPFKTGMNSGYDEYTGQRSSDPSDGDTSVTNRNLVQQLEGIAIHWTRQIKGVLSSHERDISTDSEGPIEELRYWKSRAKDLSSISDQLQSAEVQHIVSILNDACSKYAQPVEALTNLIEMGLQEAENIVKFLSILQEPCERLSKLKPEEIPSLLPELMNCTRLIFSLSSNYNTYERISGLLRRISGEIIRQCSSHISLNELFYGEVNDIVTILTQCIKCGKEWKDLYNRTSVSVNNRIKQSHLKEDPKSASSWQRNDASIFAEIDAFLQRCEDLIDVCHGRTQFITLLCGSGTNEIPASEVTQKLLGGMDGPEIEQTLEALSVSFRTQIDRLHNLDYNILDARASQWHNDYNSFKAVLKDLDTMVINIINKAFEQIKVIGTAVHLLLSFRQLAFRPAIQLCVSKKSADVRMLFKKQCQSIRQEFDDFHRKPPLRMNEPRFAGAALWAKSLSATIDDGWTIVKDSTTIGKSDIDELEVFVDNLKSALYSYQSQKYNDWLDTFSDMDTASFQQRLNQPILRKNEMNRKQPYPTLASTFDCSIIAVLTEAHFWDKLHSDEFATPNVILGICHQREVLRLVRERVMILVRAYNELIDDLSGISELYTDYLKRLEKKIYPGFTKVMWSTRQIVIERYVQTSVNQIHEVHHQVKIFHQKMKTVETKCQLLGTMQFVRIDRNVIYKGRQFETQQSEHRNETKKLCLKYHEKIKDEIESLYQHFCDGTQDVQNAWNRHVAVVDSKILASLFQCVKTSLRTFSNAVDGQSLTGEAHPLFSVSMILKNGEVECRPSMIEITSSVNTVAKELIGISKSMRRFFSGQKQNKETQRINLGNAFYEEISSDKTILNLVVQIMKGTASCVSSVQKKLLHWETYRSLWDMDKESFLRRYSKTKQKSFEEDINRYKNLETAVHRERSSVMISFIQLSFSGLKSTLKSHSVEFQEKLLELLKKNTTEHVCTLHDFFSTNIYKLSRPIQSIGSLCETTDLIVEIDERCKTIDKEFEPLERAYKTLSNFDKERINPKHEEMLKNLKPRHKDLLDQISDTKIRMEKSKIFIKSEFQTLVSNHQDRMVMLCNTIEEALSTQSKKTTKEINTWIKSVSDDIKSHKTKAKNLQQGLDFFGIDLPDPQELLSAENNVLLMENVLANSLSWQSIWDKWLTTAISKLDIHEMESTCSQYLKDLMKMKRLIRGWTMWREFRERLEHFKDVFPLIQDLLNEGMRKRHWDTIGEAICRDLSFSREQFTLNDIFLLGLQRHAKLISDLSIEASRELTVERTLEEMQDRLSNTNIEFTSYKDTFKIIITDELYTMIEDDAVSLQSIKSSSIGDAFQAQITAHEKNLNYVSEFVESFTIMQRQWLYLENIFIGSGGDIGVQLPQEYKTFSSLNDRFKEMMKNLYTKKNVTSICREGCTTSVDEMTLQMEEIQKSLDNYLEMKRKAFPRFYFISDDDLLELIGKSKEPEQVQKHMKKCFEGVDSLMLEKKCDGDTYCATGVKASDGETLGFVTNVAIDGSIEVWLRKVLDEVQLSVKRSLDGCTKGLKSAKKETWVREWQGQVLITAGAISWTRGCARALELIESGRDKHALRSYRKKQVSLLRRLTEMVRDSSQQRIDRSKIVALITMEVHNRDVVEKLLRSGCQDPNDFTWTSQLRFLMEKGDDYATCTVRQTYCQLSYGYEYQGNNGRLVVTPLTDRCVLTLITAKFLHRGGNPLGPAGTGKTETVKDLAKNLAYFCVVSNCSEAMDFKSVGRIFSGLCQSGAWGCFDEFNRIKVEVISVVAMQISAILNALRCNESVFNFMGSKINCSPHTGIFITMNPGYAGRTELPDNLKALMRPVAMMAPDLNLIAEVILSAEGFANSRVLAKKSITLYNLMQQQLSKQSHYDYGLRSIKGVLTMAGTLKRTENDIDEEQIIIRAVKCMNEPKFVKDDLTLFYLLLSDLFPNRNMEKTHAGQLQDVIEQSLVENNLQVVEYAVQKTLELAYSMNIRHCNMIIGETLTGKTSIWQTLCSAKQLLPTDNDHYTSSVNKCIINPKALNIKELYGSYDLVTFEWTDGVISSIFKNFSESSKHDVEKWLIFDGPVDALWIESMNSVMDDNKILTLVNGDRISLAASMSLLFEVENLSVASPATVSRAGMIYIDGHIGWKPFLQSWLDKNIDLFQGSRTIIDELCDKYLKPVLYLKAKRCKESIQITDCAAIKSFTIMCDNFLPIVLKQESVDASFSNTLEKWFIFCVIWSIGGAVDNTGRKLIDQCIRDIDSHFLPSQSIYDYFIDPKTNEFELWESKVSRVTKNGTCPSFHDIIVPTQDTVRNSYIINTLVRNGHRALITGNTGCGKTNLAISLLEKLQDRISTARINLSSTIESQQLQFIMTELLEKRSKDKLGPAYGAEKLLIFIDDLNLPRQTSNESPYQPPLELLRHFIGYGGWYDRKKCSWQSVMNTQVVCAMTPPSAGRAAIPSRLQSQFHVMNCVDPSKTQVVAIFKSILDIGLNSCRSEIKSAFDIISKATYDIYVNSKQRFLPKPGKSHYDFNLRDIFKVVQGMLLANNISIDSKDSLYCLWIHECMRSFSDRFIEDRENDESKFTDILAKSLEQYLSCDVDIFESQTISSSIKGPLFTSIKVGFNDTAVKSYMQIHEKEPLRNCLQDQLLDYNDDGSFAAMDLVLFDDTLKHICRIHRVLQMERGNMLFVGIGGSGRESLTRLAGFIANIKIFTVEITKKYRREEFREDLKSLCTKCGIENERTLFFLKDKHIKSEAFLEDVSNLLVSGEVQGLFCKDERSGICDEVRKDALLAGVEESENLVWNFFIDRIRNNLHIIMAMSPIGHTLVSRLRSYPTLLNCTTMNWFNSWPCEALEQVAYKYLSKSDLEKGSEKQISEAFAMIHQRSLQLSDDMRINLKRYNYVTPTNYLELVVGFQKLLHKKRHDLDNHKTKLSSGLEKLEDGRAQVEEMKEHLKEKQLIVEQSQKDCEAMLETIVFEKRAAEQQREIVIKDSERIGKEEKQCTIIAEEAEADLAIALPALESALAQVDKLDKSAITEIKAYSKPPAAVERVLSCVMILMGRHTDWATAKRVLGETNFLTNLKSFDKDNVKDSIIAKISKFIKSPSFAADEVSKVSKAAGALCVWCHAIHLYAGVAKEVAPKRARLKTAQDGLAMKQQDLTKAKNALEVATTKLAKLREQYDCSVSKKNQLTSEALDLEDKLSRAEKLINGLSGEYIRWTKSIHDIENQSSTILGDVVISSAFLSYAGPFDAEYRSKLLTMWASDVKSKNMQMSQGFATSNFLSSSIDVREWNSQGLPKDDFSTENAIIVTQSSRWPLLIDPQGQGYSWIKSMEGNTLKLIDIKSKDFMRDLELAISFGLPAMLVNTGEELDASLEPILSKAVVKTGGRFVICLGDKEIDFNENFRLYITTSLPNPHYTPEVSAKTTVVNFAVTEIGLEEQLLALVVNEEEPDLESRKSELVIKLANGKRNLVELEDSILLLLSESSGSLIDDINLIDTLQSSKTTAEEVNEQLKIAKKTEEKIDIARESFRSAARRSSIIFFTLKDLSLVDPMYQFSLDSYMTTFRYNIIKSRHHKVAIEIDTNDQGRVGVVNQYHTLNVYESTSIGLFSKDKTLFALQLCVRIMRDQGKIPKNEFEFICQGKTLSEQRRTNDTISFHWLGERTHESLLHLDNVIDGIVSGIREEEKEWMTWFNSKNPETLPLPGKWESKLSLLQKLCILRALRLDRVLYAVSQFISVHIGHQFASAPTFDLEKIFEKSSCTTPLIFILSPGVDPNDQIATLAKEHSVDFTQVALGQGQAPVALVAIEKACNDGGWVLLANCHLMLSWMEDLENIIDEFCNNSTTHNNFRLWLSSKPSAHFPLSILQRGIKMTTEPPQGLRANMGKLYSLINQTEFKKCKEHSKYKKFLFSLTWLHSVLLERRKFKTLGFNTPYDFNDSDFLICHDLLIVLLDEYPDNTPFKALQYLIGDANYGGRVTDEWDRKLLGVYMQMFFCEDALSKDRFLLSDVSEYFIPPDGDLASYKSFIDSLPSFDDPAAFGQHPNAEISSQIEDVNNLLETVSSLRSGRSTINTNNDNVGEQIIAKLNGIPDLFSDDRVQSYVQKTSDSSAMQTFLLQEIQRYNSLLALLQKMKDDLDKALKGLIMLTPELENIMENLTNFKVPTEWLQFYPSLKPLDSWLNDLRERVKQLDEWIDNKAPTVFWLSGFTYPSSFITSVLQTTARAKGCAIDSLSWEFEVMTTEKEIKEQPDEGVYISGLFLEGAQWDDDNGHLKEPLPMLMQSQMPIIHFKPIEMRKRSKDEMYHCPIYAYPLRAGTPQRPSYVLTVDLHRGNKSADHWTKRGVAMLLSTAE